MTTETTTMNERDVGDEGQPFDEEQFLAEMAMDRAAMEEAEAAANN